MGGKKKEKTPLKKAIMFNKEKIISCIQFVRLFLSSFFSEQSGIQFMYVMQTNTTSFFIVNLYTYICIFKLANHLWSYLFGITLVWKKGREEKLPSGASQTGAQIFQFHYSAFLQISHFFLIVEEIIISFVVASAQRIRAIGQAK